MSAKHKTTKAKKIKTLFVFGLLCIIFLFSLFVSNKKDEEANNEQYYPREVETAMDSLSEFLAKVDSTLNVLKDSLKVESYEQRTGK
ncbi:MAG: hypothetical protein LBL13_10385 [Bacteroidales bacterium]|jgi:flagellar basal body-associated protein FliL|nr:hypothetical protein [Bacteroidales bacterium]